MFYSLQDDVDVERALTWMCVPTEGTSILLDNQDQSCKAAPLVFMMSPNAYLNHSG